MTPATTTGTRGQTSRGDRDEAAVDVAIIGAGYAGLQAALTLGRACRSVVVFDGGAPRNSSADHVHNFLGYDEASPTVILGAAKQILVEHDVAHVDARVESGTRDPQSGAITLSDSTGRVWSARAVVLATGYLDELPLIDGLDKLWGTRVAACPHCHGWEVRGAALAMLANPGMPARSIERALLLSRWSPHTTFLTAGIDIAPHERKRLAAAGVTTIAATVRSVHPVGLNSVELLLENSPTLTARMLYITPTPRHQSRLAQLLGCDLTVANDPTGAVQSDHGGRTTVANVWATGTAAESALLAIGAAGHASSVAVAVNQSLLEDDINRAIDVYSGHPSV